jgi:hypothetical protein
MNEGQQTQNDNKSSHCLWRNDLKKLPEGLVAVSVSPDREKFLNFFVLIVICYLSYNYKCLFLINSDTKINVKSI